MRCSRIFGPSSRGPPVRAPGTAGAVTVAAFAVMASRWSRGAVDSPTTLSTLPPQAAFAAESLVTRYVPVRAAGPPTPFGRPDGARRADRFGAGAELYGSRVPVHRPAPPGSAGIQPAERSLAAPAPVLSSVSAARPRSWREAGLPAPVTGITARERASSRPGFPARSGPRRSRAPCTSSCRRNIDSPAGTRPAPASRRPVPGYSAPSVPRCIRSAAPSAQASPRRCPAPPAASSPAPSPPREGASPRRSGQSERPQNALLTWC